MIWHCAGGVRCGAYGLHSASVQLFSGGIIAACPHRLILRCTLVSVSEDTTRIFSTAPVPVSYTHLTLPTTPYV